MGKRHIIQNRMKSSVVNNKAVKEQTKINECLYYFYEKLFFKNNGLHLWTKYIAMSTTAF